MDAIQKVTGSQSAHVQASCSGGILAAMTVAHLSAMGEADRIASLTLMVTVLDQGREGLAAAIDETTAKLAIAFRRAKATSTAERWPRCSPGCAPPTWCGGTGSTTIFRAGHRLRLTCCSGTPTPRACPLRGCRRTARRDGQLEEPHRYGSACRDSNKGESTHCWQTQRRS